MKRILLSVVMLAGLAGCAPAAQTEEDAVAGAATASNECSRPESGMIRPQSPGIEETRLKGPFMVKMLQTVVDPANPHGATLYWTGPEVNVTFLVDYFKGPLYLGPNESLGGPQEFMPIGVIYSGCRLD